MGGEGIIIHKELSYVIVGALFEVYNELGYGYHEKHYERALEKYFIHNNIQYKRQAPYKIRFKNETVGIYYLDFLVNNQIVLELKKGRYFSKGNIEQVKGYLKVTNMKLAILANFMPNGVKFFRVLNPNNKNL